jgi:hypothetical protein
VKADFQLLVGACYNLSCLLFILPKNKSLALSSVRHVESMYVSKPSSQDQIRKLARWGMFCGTFNQVGDYTSIGKRGRSSFDRLHGLRPRQKE